MNQQFINSVKWFAVAAVCICSTARGDWPSFLGGTQREQAQVDLPLTWSPEEGTAWKTSLPGHGQSSPVVVGDNIYLTAVEGPQKETNIVLCFSLKSGKQLWRHDLPSSLQVKNDPYTSRAAPTAAADANGVYAFFESGDLVALDTQGSKLWQRDLLSDYGRYEGRFGLGGSLAQDDKSVFVLADNDGPAYLLAVDKKTGETLWKTDRSSRTSWSSPVMVSVAGQPQIAISSAGSIDGYDPQTGSLIWSFTDVGGNTVASPIPFDDGKFLIGASPGRNGENSDGAMRSNMALQVTPADDGFKTKVLWRNEKATVSFGSPIVYRGMAYYVNRAGVVYCINVQTGEPAYTQRIAESVWATPVGSDNRVYFFGQHGKTTVLKAGEEYEELAVNRLWPDDPSASENGGFAAEIQYGVALTVSGVLVRTGSNLYLIGGREAQ